ncbi:retbindin [Hyperolius riggenbachi]|uniref:retbindin n=1 Tax=Hyperolius riggenbachi TaxID=752182 RepID=UPI0035A3C380
MRCDEQEERGGWRKSVHPLGNSSSITASRRHRVTEPGDNLRPSHTAVQDTMSALLLSLLPFFLLLSQSWGHPDRCLTERKQKLMASAESGLTKCQQYSSHSCCSQEHIDALPSVAFPWEGCGPLSPRCEEYISRVQCMYLCSPHISKWGLPGTVAGIHELPLCDAFCDEWFEACKEDLICSRHSNADRNCSKGCISYAQKFGSGGKLCDTIWKHSFVAVTEQCFCITPLEEGADVSQEDQAYTELEIVPVGSSGFPEMCAQDPHKIPHKRRMRRAVWKRQAPIEGEGSGSGNGAQ